jgi:REP element-mobilizing transposase RayT
MLQGMARKLRLEYAGACYHVINRGNYRRNVFGPRGAAEAFERCLRETCERFGWRVHAYVIMRNHFHLAVETPEPNLSVGMKFLQGTWANRFNRFHGETGRPFQGRYKGLHVEAGAALAQVAHYIHLNPVRAKVVSAARLTEFRWSSLWWFPQKSRPAFLEPATVLREAGGLDDTAVGWQRYREYLRVLAAETPKERERQFGALSRGWVVGTQAFRTGLIGDLRQRGAALQGATRPGESAGERQVLRAEIWEERLQAAAQTAGIVLDELGPRKSAPEKVLLAAAMKAGTDVSNGWLCERLGMGTPASVSQFVRRFRLAEGTDQAGFNAVLSRVKM